MKRKSMQIEMEDLRRIRERLPAWFGGQVDQLLAHPDYSIREEAIRVIGRCRARRYIPQLVKALQARANCDYMLQVAAMEAMGQISDVSFVPYLLKAWLTEELLNVRRVARRELNDLLSAHRLRDRYGFGATHSSRLNEKHPVSAGSSTSIDRQLSEQIRLTKVTGPVLYDTPAFCRYCAGERPVLERGMDLLVPRVVSSARTAQVVLAWLHRGLVAPLPAGRKSFGAWWRKASRGIPLKTEWEEEAVLARGTADDPGRLPGRLRASARAGGLGIMLSRCLIALCRCRQVPGRLVFWYHADGRQQHAMAELFLDDGWVLYDLTYGLRWNYSARDLLGKPSLAGRAHAVPTVTRQGKNFSSRYIVPELFHQAGVVPVDQMGIDY